MSEPPNPDARPATPAGSKRRRSMPTWVFLVVAAVLAVFIVAKLQATRQAPAGPAASQAARP